MQTVLTRLINNRIHGLKSNSLVITVVIALVLGIMSSLLILLAYYNRDFQKEISINEKLDRNVQSAISMVLADTTNVLTGNRIEMDLFGRQEDSVAIQQSQWGLYRIAIVDAMDLTRSRKQKFLYGSVLPACTKGCLYLVDHSRTLSLVGNTNLDGDAYVSQGGIRPAYIDQRGFDKPKLVEGKILISEKFPPPLNDQTLKYIYGLLHFGEEPGRGIPRETSIPDTLKRSFADSLLLVEAKEEVNIKNCFISGKIIIKSDTLIEVDATASLENTVLVAPVVRIKKGFTGILQVFASDSIVIEEDCILQYPSALVLAKDTLKSTQSEINIGKSSTINGGIYSITSIKDINKTKVSIAKGCLIEGVLYVNGYLFLDGNVNGSVVTDFFLYKSNASIYENHLVDVTIDRKKLSPYHIGSFIFSERTKREIIQWLD